MAGRRCPGPTAPRRSRSTSARGAADALAEGWAGGRIGPFGSEVYTAPVQRLAAPARLAAGRGGRAAGRRPVGERSPPTAASRGRSCAWPPTLLAPLRWSRWRPRGPAVHPAGDRIAARQRRRRGRNLVGVGGRGRHRRGRGAAGHAVAAQRARYAAAHRRRRAAATGGRRALAARLQPPRPDHAAVRERL